jgi:outer membrane protein assembly factor BamB
MPRPLLIALLALLGVSGCALQGRSTHHQLTATTATPASALTASTIYWSQGDHLWALRASDGQTLWSRALGHGSLRWSDLAFSQQGLVLAADKTTLYALHPTDGHIVWTYHTGTEWVGPIAVAGDRLYLGMDGLLTVLDAGSGIRVQMYAAVPPPDVTGEPVRYLWTKPMLLPGALVVAGVSCAVSCLSGPGAPMAIDLNSGQVLWTRTDLARI